MTPDNCFFRILEKVKINFRITTCGFDGRDFGFDGRGWVYFVCKMIHESEKDISEIWGPSKS